MALCRADSAHLCHVRTWEAFGCIYQQQPMIMVAGGDGSIAGGDGSIWLYVWLTVYIPECLGLWNLCQIGGPRATGLELLAKFLAVTERGGSPVLDRP